MEIPRRNYPVLPSQSAPHFQSVRVGNFLFLSGAMARNTAAEYKDMAEADWLLRWLIWSR